MGEMARRGRSLSQGFSLVRPALKESSSSLCGASRSRKLAGSGSRKWIGRLLHSALLVVLASGLGLLTACGRDTALPIATRLVELFPLAETSSAIPLFTLGTPEPDPRLLEGWSDHDAPEVRQFIYGIGKYSTLRLVIPEPGPLELLARCRPFRFPGSPDQSITIYLNEQKVGYLTLDYRDEFREYRVPLPEATQLAGNNVLEFHYGYHRRPADVIPGARDHRDLAVAWQSLHLVGGAPYSPWVESRDRTEALMIPFFTSVDYYLRIPEGGSLVIKRVLSWRKDHGANESAGSPSLLVSVAAGDASRVRRYEFAPSRSADSEHSVLLPASSKGPIRISFQAVPVGLGTRGAAGIKLVEPVVHSTSPEMPALSVGDVSMPPSTGKRPNVLIYMVDTLRVDHLGCYGYERPTSPNIDAFAAEATLFSAAHAQASWTRPAVASLLTGVEPWVHGANDRKDGLAESLPFLPEMLGDLGYETAAFVANGNVSQSIGFSRGFDHYEWHPLHTMTDRIRGLSDEITDATLRWLARRSGSKPFFIYLHTVDPHEPYYGLLPLSGESGAPVHRREVTPPVFERDLIGRKAKSSSQLVEDVIGLYDRDIAFNDAQFGRLISELGKLRAFDSTMIVFLSDHGEEFRDHGGWAHGKTLFQEQLHIPLIIKFPHGYAGGKTVDTVSRQTDVLPTVLEYIGAPIPARVQGRSLLSAVSFGETTASPVPRFAYLELDGRRQQSVTAEGMKLIHYQVEYSGRPEYELYNLAVDPRESTNLAARQPLWAGYLRSLLKTLLQESGYAVIVPEVTIDVELKKRLLGLGYLD